jgi:hypothetical protein
VLRPDRGWRDDALQASVPDRARGYKCYCRFSAFMESANDCFQWQEGSANPEIVTIFYAGTVATEIMRQKHGWEYERVREGDQDHAHFFHSASATIHHFSWFILGIATSIATV